MWRDNMSIAYEKEKINKWEKDIHGIIALAQVPQDEKNYYFPDSLNQPFERFEPDVRDIAYFIISGYYGNYETVPLTKIVGSADIELAEKDTWLEAIVSPRNFMNSYAIAEAQINYYKTECRGQDPIKLYKKDDKYYVVDGNHRINVLRLLKAMEEEQETQIYSNQVYAFVRQLPKDKKFQDEFVNFVERNHIYDVEEDPYDGYETYTPHFEVKKDPQEPEIIHIKTGMIIHDMDSLQQFKDNYNSGKIYTKKK